MWGYDDAKDDGDVLKNLSHNLCSISLDLALLKLLAMGTLNGAHHRCKDYYRYVCRIRALNYYDINLYCICEYHSLAYVSRIGLLPRHLASMAHVKYLHLS